MTNEVRQSNPDNNRILTEAIYQLEKDFRAVLNKDGSAIGVEDALYLALELIGCLRRLLPNVPVNAIHRAFGAPGDFGYHTAIGQALASIYGLKI
jgi:hypothetical protein